VDIAPTPDLPQQAAALELLQSGFRYAFSLSHHRHDAEDLAQEAWLKLCVRYGGATSRAALFTTIRNLFIDRCRRANILAFDSWDEDPPNLTAPENAAPGAFADLDRLLKELRPGEREAIYLHYVEGHTAEEVGVITRQPRGTVLSLLHRALHKLKIAAAASASDAKSPEPERNQ
jgi:RNA polymerase sigma factor (sigma-70 family)